MFAFQAHKGLPLLQKKKKKSTCFCSHSHNLYGNEILIYFQTEVNYLGQLYHPNLVKLIGYCLEGENRLLVYEFMPKGSLENHLFRSKLP